MVICLFFAQQTQAQHPIREFRAAWITTFHNLDWPSSKELNAEEQKKEYADILDRVKKYNFNAVITQIRASGDAFYPSEICEWSEYLCGKQGKDPGYDPLEFMVKESHLRGLEFHAWFNPFRAISHKRFSSVAENNVYHKKPEYFFEYGNSVYFDPGVPEVRDLLIETVLEVVRKYDIDAVHFDDYFYPYKLKGLDLPDADTYKKYGADFKNIEDWRRANIDDFIGRLSKAISEEKPQLKFGISPHGVWRNVNNDENGSISNTGHASYDDLYSDTKKWVNNKWIDYIAPQLYWSTEHPTGNFLNLLSWWSSQKFDAHLYVGHALYKFEKPPNEHWKNANEMKVQVGLGRLVNKVKGGVYFRYKILEHNPNGVSDSLVNGPYKYPALIPTMNWKKGETPDAPFRIRTTNLNNKASLEWQVRSNENQKYFVVFKVPQNTKINYNDPSQIFYIGQNNRVEIDQDEIATYIVRSANSAHQLSKPSKLVKYIPASGDKSEVNQSLQNSDPQPNPNKT